jgi:pyruvate,water dikinase
MQEFIKHFNDLTPGDLLSAGNKGIRLSACYREERDTPLVTEGFVVTGNAFKFYLANNNSENKLLQLLATATDNADINMSEMAARCRKIIVNGKMPYELEHAIITTYLHYFSENGDVAVRGSIITPETAITDTYLNIRGTIALSYAVKCCFASVFTEQLVETIIQNNLGIPQVNMAVVIQKMVRSDLATSGTVQASGNTVTIKSILGLGELLHTGEAEPDIITLHAVNGNLTVSSTVAGKKGRMYVYADHPAGTNSTLLKISPAGLRDHYALTHEETITLAQLAVKGYNCFEWAKDGITNRFYIINPHKTVDKANVSDEYYYQ